MVAISVVIIDNQNLRLWKTIVFEAVTLSIISYGYFYDE